MSAVFTPIEEAMAAFAKGQMVIMVDDENRENEGDLVIAADFADAEAINFMARFGRGLICLSMHSSMIDNLGLPMMIEKNQSQYKTAFTVSIEALEGVSTGISAADRATTIRAAIQTDAQPGDVISPGHIFPLRARDGGVLERQGQTEGSVDLAKLSGLTPAAVICEIMNDDGTMARLEDLQVFAQQHQLPIVAVHDLMAYRLRTENHVECIAQTRLPIHNGSTLDLRVMKFAFDQSEHLLLSNPGASDKPPLVRIHSECLTGDVLGSSRCDCGQQLQAAIEHISQQGGYLLYMRQEGRGIGLVNKIKAYALQDQGMDTVEANQHLGFEPDQRDYGVCAQILRAVDVNTIRLLTNNPRKVDNLQNYGITISERVAIEMPANAQNRDYLRTKRDKLGHWLSLSDIKEKIQALN